MKEKIFLLQLLKCVWTVDMGLKYVYIYLPLILNSDYVSKVLWQFADVIIQFDTTTTIKLRQISMIIY